MRKSYNAVIILILAVLAGWLIMRESVVSAHGFPNLENSTGVGYESDRSILNDWNYTEIEDSIILNKYIGTSAHIVIPGVINGKQVFLQNFNTNAEPECFPKNTTSIVVGSIDQKVKVVDGNAAWLFSGLEELTYMDVRGLDTSDITSMYRMFFNCSNLTHLNLSGWDTGRVTDMSYMFQNCSNLTELDINGWNTGSVTTMYNLFRECKSLTRLDLSSWNMSSVTEISCMFYGCTGLTELNLSSWDTGNITGNRMEAVFYNCSSLVRLDVSGWNTSGVASMQNMFFNCSSLKQLDLSSWDTGSVASINYMFYYCTDLIELKLYGWNTGNVQSMLYTFNNCSKLQILDLSGHDYSNVMPGWTVGVFDLVDASVMLPTLIISNDSLIQSICERPITGRVPAGPIYHLGEGRFTDDEGNILSTMKYFDTILITDISDFTIASIASKYIPEKEGGIFTGWYLDEAYTQPFKTAGKNMELIDLLNTHLYAKYLNQYTVTFMDYDGSIIKETIVLEGGSAIAPESNPVRDGYKFTGWDRDFENVTEDMIIKALYEEVNEVQDNTAEENIEIDTPDVSEVPKEADLTENMHSELSDGTKTKMAASTPKTGDTSAVRFYFILLLFSIMSIAILNLKKL